MTVNEVVELRVEGMGCHHCVSTIQKTLSSLAGVEDVAVSLEDGLVTLRGTGVDREEAVRVLLREGYVVPA